MAKLQSIIIVFHGRHFVRHLEICNPICVKLFFAYYVRCYSAQSKDTTSLSQTVFLRSTNVACTQIHRHTHDDSIRRNAMRCIRLKMIRSVTAFAQFAVAHCRELGHRYSQGLLLIVDVPHILAFRK